MDRIDLSALAGTFTFIGNAGFSGTAREVQVVNAPGGSSNVYVDTNGDGTADMRIFLEGARGLSEDDFVL